MIRVLAWGLLYLILLDVVLFFLAVSLTSVYVLVRAVRLLYLSTR